MSRPSGDLAAIVFVYSLLAISVGYHIYRSTAPSQFGLHREQANQHDAHKTECEAKLRLLGLDVAAAGGASGDTGEIKNHYELCQQIRAAQAAEDQAYWATPQFYVSLGSFILLAGATGFAYGAYSQAKRQAFAAEAQATIAESAYRNLERPYVLMQPDFSTFQGPRARVSVQNFGRTPAILGPSSVHFLTSDSAPIDVMTSVNVLIGSQSILGASESGKPFVDDKWLPSSDPGWLDATRGVGTLWLIGVINYRDTQGMVYWQEFCWDYDPNERVFFRYRDQYNRSGVGRYSGPWTTN